MNRETIDTLKQYGEPLFRTSRPAAAVSRRMMPVAAILAGAIIAMTMAGGCKNAEKETGRAEPGPVTGEKTRTPYYYGLIEEYRGILAGDPHNLAANIALGNAYFEAGQWKLAIQFYEQALHFDPSNADVITDMGTCYRNLGMPDRAIAEYVRALKIEPTHQNALFNLGVVYGYDRKDYATAIRYWERLLHVSPKHPRAEYLQANIAQFKKAMRYHTP